MEFSVLRILTLAALIIIPLAIGAFIALIILRQKFVAAICAMINLLRLERFSFTQRGVDVLQFLAEQDGGMVLRLYLDGRNLFADLYGIDDVMGLCQPARFFADRSGFRSCVCKFLDSIDIVASDPGLWRTWRVGNQPGIFVRSLWDSCFGNGDNQCWPACQFLFIQSGFPFVFAISKPFPQKRYTSSILQ